MIKLYSVHDHWTDINKKNDVDIESIDGVIAGIKVNGEDYGGIEWQNIYDNTITTVLNSDGFYTTNIGVVIEADSIKVTFDGVEYSCPKRSISEISTNFYGAPTPLETGEEGFDWTDFPFSIVTGSNGASMVVTTQTAGTHTLKIDTPQSGGGESDFSIATLKITNTTENPVICEVPCYRDGAEIATAKAVTFRAFGDEPTTATFKVICKTNGATLSIVTTGVTATTSGDIQYIEAENMYIITGDCAITVSGSQPV